MSSVALEPPAGASRHAYKNDLFISYHDDDWPRVEAELVKPLASAKLKVTGEWELDPGADLKAARDDAIEASRHTLIVLSRCWCQSYLTQGDAQAARYLDPTAKDRRLLPLLLEECSPPKPIQQLVERLVTLNFTKIHLRQASLARLLNLLGSTQEAVSEAMAQSAQKGLSALVELMGTEAVRTAVATMKESLKSARDQISYLDRCKRMHEYLHGADEQFKQFIPLKDELLAELNTLDEPEDREARCADRWEKVDRFFQLNLNPHLGKLVGYARGGDYPEHQVVWVLAVERAQEDLAKACESREVKPLKSAVRGLMPVLGQQPTMFDTELFNAAHHLELNQLAQSLQNIRSSIDQVQFEATTKALLEDFQRGITALADFHQRLLDLVINHNCLQQIDFSLRTLPGPSVDAEEIEGIWANLHDWTQRLRMLSGADWVLPFLKTRDSLDQAIAQSTSGANGKISSPFIRFCGQVSNGMTQVDLELLRFCARLKKIGDELTHAIQRMQHGQ